jgi:hypothetical protein
MRTKLIYILLGLVSILPSISQAQNCASNDSWTWPGHRNWFVAPPNQWTGNIVDMTNGAVTTVGVNGGSVAAGGAITSYEGVASVSDDNGNLLWYTNGRRLWRGTGAGATLMYSGLLAGNEGGATGNNGSAVQGIMIAKHPLDADRYYVFTSDDANSGTKNGLNYWTFDSGGNLLSGPTRLGAFVTTEGIAVTRHANGVDIWVAVMETGTGLFNAYLITCAGIDIPNSNLGQAGAPVVNGQQDRGSIAFSWDGTRFAQAHPNQWPTADQQVSLYDFDNATGAITNPMHIAPTGTILAPYDITFSPDNSRLYLSRQSGLGLEYFDLSSGVAATITASRASTGIPTGFSSLEIGPGPALYTTTGNDGAAIVRVNPTNGDLNTATTFSATNYTSLGTARSGLPIMYVPPTDEPEIQDPGVLCDTDAPVDLATLWACGGGDAEGNHTYSGTGITNATTGTFDPALAGVGSHQIIFSLNGSCNAINDTINISVISCGGCSDTTLANVIAPLCVGESVDLSGYEVTADPGSWSIVSTPGGGSPATIIGSTFDATNADAGTYRIRFTLNGSPIANCPDSAERDIEVNALPNINITPDPAAFCAGDSVQLDAGVGGLNYAWTPTGDNTQTTWATSGGVHQVVVTNPATGCSDSASVNVTENALPVINISPNPAEFCAGDSVQLDAGIGAMNYAWTPTGDNTQTTWATNGGVYQVVVTNPATGCSDSASVNVTENALPVINLTPNPAEFCAGDSIQLDAGIGGQNYAWTPTGDNTQTTWATSGGVHQVVVTNPATGCSDSASVNVTENALPVINISPNPAEFCAGDSVQLDAGIGAMNYAWTPTGDNTQTTWATNGGVYQVVVTNPATGCSDSASVNVTENALPVINLTPNPAEFCAGDSVELDAGIGGMNYAWTPTGDNTQTTFATSSGIHQVIVTDPASGCSDSASINVTENALPLINITPNPAAFCSGDSVLVDAGNAGGVSYLWTPTNETTQTIYAKSGGVYQVVVTDNVTGCSDSSSVNITEDPLPAINLNPNPTEFCAGDSLLLDAGLAGAYDYLWSPNGETSQAIYANTGGVYQVVVTDQATGCSDSASVTITENPLPIVDLGADTTICANVTTPLDAGNPGASHSWTRDGVAFGNTQNIDATSGAEYIVTVTDGNGCSTMDTIQVGEFDIPVVDLGSDTGVCEEISLILDADTANDIISYLWSPSNNTSRYDTLVDFSGAVSVVVTDSNGCENSDNLNVTLYTLPIVNLGPDTSTCQGGDVTFSGPDDMANYLWNDGSIGQSLTGDVPDSTYWLSVIDTNGCIASDTVQVSDRGPITVDLGENTFTLCANESITLDAGSFEAPTTYIWSTGENTQQVTYSNLPATNDTVSVQVFDRYNCPGSDSVRRVVLPYPTVEIFGGDSSFCSLGKDVYEAFIVYTGAFPGDILWSNGSSDTSTIVTYAPTTIWVSYTDSNGCSSSDTIALAEYCEPTELTLPNVFVPGGETNNIFEPIEKDNETYWLLVNNVIESDFQVFNRWGVKMFQSDALLPSWDGYYNSRPVSAGTYFWIWRYKDSSLKTYELNGFVEVVQQSN